MSISATAVRFDEHAMWVELSDGRTLGVPLAWFPRPNAKAWSLAALASTGRTSTKISPLPACLPVEAT
jgi:hypothetical protein